MSPLETLFRLEIEFHRHLRAQASGTDDIISLRKSRALQSGYEQLIRSIGPITAHDAETSHERLPGGAMPACPSCRSWAFRLVILTL